MNMAMKKATTMGYQSFCETKGVLNKNVVVRFTLYLLISIML